MSDLDLTMKNYMKDPNVFADVFNYALYQGKQVIKPEALQELDPEEIIFINGRKGKKTRKKQRDVLKKYATCKYDGEKIYCLLGIENQGYVHYAGPFVARSYDQGRLDKQVRDIKDAHDDAQDLTSDERMSGFAKTDRIAPVITYMINFTGRVWDGPMSLHEMYKGHYTRRMLSKMLDYKLNLIDPLTMSKDEFQSFVTDAGSVLEFSTYKENKDGMEAFINKDMDKFISAKGARVIDALGNLGIKIKKGAKKVNMCRAMEELKQDWQKEAEEKGMTKGIEKGIEKGRSEGKAEGRNEGILSTLLTNVKALMRNMHITSNDAMDLLEVSEDNRIALMKML